MGKTSKVTMDDVAMAAGVSRSTAALVLREGRIITPDTRERVIAAADRLGYMAKGGPALNPPTKDAEVIGVALPDIGNFFFSSMYIGINNFFDQYENFTIFFCSHFDSIEKQRRFLKNLYRHDVAGIIIAPSLGTTRDEMEQIKTAGTPLVFTTRRIEGMDASYVAGDNESGGFEATRHLIEMKHRRISILGGLESISTYNDRVAGYRRALDMYQIPFDASLIVPGVVSSRWAQESVKALLLRDDPPTAIICYNDTIASGVVSGLSEIGKTPGRNVAIIKFDYAAMQSGKGSDGISTIQTDNADSLYRNPYPEYTSVQGNMYQWGYEAAKLLFRKIVGLSTTTERIIFPQTLIIRRSSIAPCASSAQDT